MLDKKKFTILTGNGISFGSSLPIYRDQDGKPMGIKRYADETKQKDICTVNFFSKNPMATWEMFSDYYKLTTDNQPSSVH